MNSGNRFDLTSVSFNSWGIVGPKDSKLIAVSWPNYETETGAPSDYDTEDSEQEISGMQLPKNNTAKDPPNRLSSIGSDRTEREIDPRPRGTLMASMNFDRYNTGRRERSKALNRTKGHPTLRGESHISQSVTGNALDNSSARRQNKKSSTLDDLAQLDPGMRSGLITPHTNPVAPEWKQVSNDIEGLHEHAESSALLELEKVQGVLNKEREGIKKGQGGVKRDWEEIEQGWAEIKKRQEEIMQEKEEIRQEREEIRQEREEIQQEREKIKQQEEEIKQEQEEIRKEWDGLKRKREAINKGREEVKKGRGGIKQEQEEIKKERDSIKREWEIVKKQRARFETERRQLQQEVEKRGLKAAEALLQVEGANKWATEAEKKVKDLEGELKMLQHTKNRQSPLTQMEHELMEILNESKQRESSWMDCMKEVDLRHKEEAEAMTLEIDQLKQELSSTQDKVSALTNDVARLSNLKPEIVRDDYYFSSNFSNLFLSVQDLVLRYYIGPHCRSAYQTVPSELQEIFSGIAGSNWLSMLTKNSMRMLQALIVELLCRPLFNTWFLGILGNVSQARKVIRQSGHKDLIQWHNLTTSMMLGHPRFHEMFQNIVSKVTMQLSNYMTLFANPTKQATALSRALQTIVEQAATLAVEYHKEPSLFSFRFPERNSLCNCDTMSDVEGVLKDADFEKSQVALAVTPIIYRRGSDGVQVVIAKANVMAVEKSG